MVAVLGLGVAGEASARALVRSGARVTVVDAKDGEAQRARAASLSDVTVLLGEETPDLSSFDLAVLSPGIAPGSPLWGAARAAKEVIGEIELAYRLGIRAIAAVTGTNGKTTVTEMLAACLRAGGRDGVAAGNIGAPLVDAVGDGIVAEISSFQAVTLAGFRVPVVVLTNIAEDHLDWHGSLAAYRAAKAHLLDAAERAAVVHVSCASLAPEVTTILYDAAAPGDDGAGIADDAIIVRGQRIVRVSDLRSQRRPFVEDAVAAAAAATLLDVAPEAIAAALRTYAPGRHRLEEVGSIGAIRFIDDSKATDPHACLAAIAAFDDAVLIAGGMNKGLDLGALRVAAPDLRAVVAIGDAADEIVAAFEGAGPPVEVATDMDDAVRRATRLAEPSGVVLLSPACASFDRFTSYAARGDAFVAAVTRLKETA